MKAPSLRLRLIIGGVIAILIALAVAGAGLVFLFERHVTRTVGDDLTIYVSQLIAGINVDAQGQLVVARPPADPRFSEPLSGLYWQITDEGGQMLRSRSLWDAALTLEPDQPAPGQVHLHEMDGPARSRVLVAERVISLMLAGRRVPVRVAVAADLAHVASATASFARDLTLALGLLGLVLAFATAVQVSLGLRPLKALQHGISEVRAGRIHHLPPAAPAEVRPLVEEVNALLDADDGKGIAPAAQASVVERGIRLDERAEGAGLGLAIVQEVLEAYGWRLVLGKSEALGGLKATLAPPEPAPAAR